MLGVPSRLGAGVAALLVMTSALCLAATTPAAADEVVATGSVVTLSQTAAVAPFPDGRLNGYGFAGRVVGAIFVGSEDDQTAGLISAAPGDQLVVFRLTLTAVNEEAMPFLPDIDQGQPTAALVVNGTQVPLPLNFGLVADVDVSWAVGIPKGAAVDLVLSREGFTQILDLRSGRPVGSHPAALYRDPSQPDLDVPQSSSAALTATSPGGTFSDQVQLTNAALSFFPPGSTGPPADLTRGALLVSLQDQGDQASGITVNTPLPTTAVQLQLPGGPLLTSSRYDPGAALGIGASGMLDGEWWFSVPAGFTTGQVVIAPTQVTGSDANANPLTLTFTDKATLAVSLPAAQPAATPPAAAPGATATPRKAASTSIPWVAWVLLGIAALCLLAIAVIVWRRRQVVVGVLPVLHTQQALLAAAGLALPPTARAALGTAPLGLPPGTVIDPAANGNGAGPRQPALAVFILGLLVVEGLRHPIRRKAVSRLLVLLALTLDRAVTADQLRFGLAADDEREPSEATLYNYLSHLRKSLPEGLLPPNQPGGYRLTRVELDWALFEGLTTKARTNQAEAPQLLSAALMMVRGQPLAGASWAGVDDQLRHVTAAVEAAAHQAAGLYLAAGNARQAEWAIGQGLLASPGCVGLWEDRLLGAAAGSGYGLDRAWADANQVLGGDAALLAPTYRRLREALV
jgi:hypothetical protein